MNSKDLMIGDWVYMGNPVTDELVPTKVANIYGEEINCKTGHTNDDVPTILFGNWLRYAQPIPLTEDILVKNGFKKESQTIDGDYCKYILPGFALNWCDTDGFWYQNGDITPNHVHTLQHLLRLCGIEKEITI